jgi:hypothetical protein
LRFERIASPTREAMRKNMIGNSDVDISGSRNIVNALQQMTSTLVRALENNKSSQSTVNRNYINAPNVNSSPSSSRNKLVEELLNQ